MHRILAWVIANGFLFCVVATTIFYHPEHIQERGLGALLQFDVGMSSYGGFIGAFLTAWVYFRIRKIPCGRYIDVLVQGLVVGWVFGRLGCTFAHDHIGLSSDFPLAFDYPSGPRHNLGFYECIFPCWCCFQLLGSGRIRSASHWFLVLLLGSFMGFFDSVWIF